MNTVLYSKEGVLEIPTFENDLKKCGPFLGLLQSRDRIFFVSESKNARKGIKTDNKLSKFIPRRIASESKNARKGIKTQSAIRPPQMEGFLVRIKKCP